MPAAYLRAMQWALLPFYFYIVLRSFVSALERPGWALAIMAVAVLFNVFANWVLMFGNLGFPAFGIVGTGIATTLSATLMCAGLALVVLLHKRFRRYHVFGRFLASRLAALSRKCCASACRFRASSPSRSACLAPRPPLLMGLIGAASLAAHAIAVQLASIAFMVPMGIAQAATVRVGRAYGAGSEQGIKMSGWVAFALGIAFMAMTATLMLTMPHLLISAFLDLDDAVNAEVVGLAVLFLAIAALFQIVDGRAGGCRRHAARAAGHEGAHVLRGDRLLGHRHAERHPAGLLVRPGGRGDLAGALHRAGGRRPHAGRALASPRPADEGANAAHPHSLSTSSISAA